MSINVHVKGNPINVTRGGMVITNSQEEFNKRRKIRLEQVRQQSKDLAHNVRKRIAKENKKQSSSEQHNLRKWQAQKLLEFEQKYQECLSSLEVPPKILSEISEETLIAERKRKNRAVALERGEKANEKLQIEKNEKSMRRSVPIQRKKFAREIENNRSVAVTNYTKRKKSKNKNHNTERKDDFHLNLSNDSEQSDHQEKEIQCNDDFGELGEEDKGFASDSPSSDTLGNTTSSSEISPKKIKISGETRYTPKIKVYQAVIHQESSSEQTNSNNNRVSVSLESPSKEIKFKDENCISYKVETARVEDSNKKKSTEKLKTCVHISDRSSVSSPKKANTLCTWPEKIEGPPIKQTLSPKSDFKRNPMRNKLFSGVENTKPTVEYVISKSRLKGVCKVQDSLSSTPERPRSPIITYEERPPEFKQQFVLDKRISEHIVNRKWTEEKRKDRNIQVKDDKKNVIVQSNINQGQFQTCLCSCYENEKDKTVSTSVCCNHPETLTEKIQTCTTTEQSCLTNEPKVKCTSTSRGINQCTQVSHMDVCEWCNLSKIDVKSIPNPKECINTSSYEIKSTKTTSNSSKKLSGKDVTCVAKSVQVPIRPSVTLSKQIKRKSIPTKSEAVQKVQMYNDTTKYSSSYAPSINLVQKIPVNNLSIVVESSDEENLIKEQSKLDKYAEIRGHNALKKEMICRDYDEIMGKLPALQKKERISSIGKDDPKYHMSEERRKEYEKRKENTIQVAYENRFPKPITITLPKRVSVSEDEKLPYKVIDMRNGPTGVNLGTWDVNKKDFPSPQHSCSYTQTVKDPDQLSIENDENMLRTLLEKLIDQKEKLEREVSRVPEGSRLHQILNDLECDLYNKKHQSEGELDSGHEKCQRNETDTQASKLPQSHENEKPREVKVNNTSTQTSPRSKQVTELPSTFACPCITEHKNDSCQKLCEIVIKVGEEANQPKIDIIPSLNGEKGIVYTLKDLKEKQNNKECDSNQPKRTSQKPEDPKLRTSPEKRRTDLYAAVTETQKTEKYSSANKNILSCKDKASWKDVLTQNSTNCTSSTSYMSPPNFKSSITKRKLNKPEKEPGVYNILCRKPQQGNLNYNSCESEENVLKDGQSNPELLNHIKHLLKMSHRSIEELNVSSVSSVSTPDSTLFACEKNKTVSQLRSICKQYNLRKEDLEKMLSVLSSSSSNGVCESTSSSSYKSASTNCLKVGRPVGNETVRCGTSDSLQKLYEEMTVKCMEKIESLSVLIENLREEKNNIMSCQKLSENADRDDSSTKYLDIEKKSSQHECDNSDKTKTDSSEGAISSQGGEDSLTKKLLEIDEALTERIKNLSSLEKSCATDNNKLQNQCNCNDSLEEVDNSLDKELMFRYKNLVCDHEKCESKNFPETEQKFVPFVSDISSLPKWEGLGPYSSHTDENLNKCTSKLNKPPPSRGLLIARRFNDEIVNYPHELSSITEVDSFTSARIRQSTSPKRHSPKQTLEVAPVCNHEKKKQTDSNNTNFPHLNSNMEDLNLLQRQKIVSQIYPPPSTTEQEVAQQKCTRSACSSPKKIIVDRLVHSEQNSPKKICPGPQQVYQKGGEVLKRARELTTRIQNLSKSFELGTSRPYSPLCGKGLIEEVHSKQKRKVITEESSSSGSNESATDVESVEKMLKSLGMGWAVATLRKTQQALALTSSSSSVDLKIEREVKIADKNSSSEISLIEYVEQRRHVSDLHSSNETNNDTSLHKFLQNISSVPASSSTFGRSTQRTSTPVNKNDTTVPGSNLIYSGESDLSSVRHSSENKSSSFKTSATIHKGTSKR